MYYIVLKCVCTNVRSLFDSYFTERELFQYVNIPSLHSRLKLNTLHSACCSV